MKRNSKNSIISRYEYHVGVCARTRAGAVTLNSRETRARDPGPTVSQPPTLGTRDTGRPDRCGAVRCIRRVESQFVLHVCYTRSIIPPLTTLRYLVRVHPVYIIVSHFLTIVRAVAFLYTSPYCVRALSYTFKGYRAGILSFIVLDTRWFVWL